MKKTLIFLGIILLLAVAAFAYLQYNKPHRNTADEVPVETLSAQGLLQEYQANEAAANEAYLDKLLLVKGKLMQVKQAEDGTTSLMLDTGDPMSAISCQLLAQEAEKLAAYQEGDEIVVKGICTGKLMDVVLVRSVIVE